MIPSQKKLEVDIRLCFTRNLIFNKYLYFNKPSTFDKMQKKPNYKNNYDV